MQARFNQDARFKVDARFAEGDSSDEAEEETINDNQGLDERTQQLQLLGEVLKKPVQTTVEKSRKTMLRFDPSQPDHSKYEIPVQKSQDKSKKRKKEEETSKEPIEEKLPEVSADTFYQINEEIPFQQTENGEAFSFLKALGRDEDYPQNEEPSVVQNGVEEDMKKKRGKSSDNPFKYDSTDDEDDEDKSNSKVTADKQETAAVRPKFWTESFFFKKDDYRFQEGIDFVKRMHGMEDDGDFSKVRRDLKKIVKRKVRNNEKKKTTFRKKLGSAASKRRNRVQKAMYRGERV